MLALIIIIFVYIVEVMITTKMFEEMNKLTVMQCINILIVLALLVLHIH